MEKQPLYILTYDHGGYVLWADRVKPRLKEIREWMEKYPRLRIGLDYESFTFDEFMREDPEVVSMVGALLRDFPDRIGLGATTYGQPLSLYVSEESNVRQLSLAVKTNLEYFGITPDVYCISEFALNNQIPQLARLSGYRAAILRSHVMGYGYTKTFNKPYGLWQGKDGTKIPAVPTYDGQGRGYNCTTLDNWILSRWPDDTDISLEDFRERFKDISPLLASRYDDLTQPIEKVTAEIEKHEDYKYLLLEDIPSVFGDTDEILEMSDNDFHSQMPWGYCGNEIFRGIRLGETDAVTAEGLNALSVLTGGASYERDSENAWKYILAAQHHDVTICGLTQLARRFIPSSLALSERVKDMSLKELEKHFARPDGEAAFLFNPHSFAVDTVVRVPSENISCVEGCDTENISTPDGRKMLSIRVSLPPLTAKSLPVKAEAAADTEEFFTFSPDGILNTPYYEILLTDCGIKRLKDKRNGNTVIASENGELLSAFINGEFRKNESSFSVRINKFTADVFYTGNIGSVPFSLTMTFFSSCAEINCRLECTVNEKDRIGRTDITEGRPVPLTVNGHHHHDKLCFNLELCMDKSREMLRDLPFSIARWDGQLRLTEEYWYPDDRILVDTPVSAEESFDGITHLQGVYWIALKDKKNGIAVINRGCMGSAVHGNHVYIPLIYSNEYMCGTKILDGTFVNEFALLPFITENTDDTDIHKAAMAYNYPPTVRLLSEGNGTLSEYSPAKLECDSKAVILTSLAPENGALTARFCNFSDRQAAAVFTPARGKADAETDLLGNVLTKISDNRLSFRPWEIKTVRITLNESQGVV